MPATLYFDVREAVRNLRLLRGRARATVARSMNRAANSAKTVGAREIASDVGLRVGTVKEQIRLTRATPQQLLATLEISGRRIPLIEFHARGPYPSRGRGRGVTYKIGETPARLPHAFIAIMRSGHRGVFRRVGTKRRPIIELLGPSLPQVFSKPSIVQTMQERYRESLLVNLKHEIEYELSRLGG